MNTKIYVGNLPYSTTNANLKSNFSEYGIVNSAKIVLDKETGKSKGFAFVEMTCADASNSAIEALHGLTVDGRTIVVNLAKPREVESSNFFARSEFKASSRPNIGYGNDGYGGQ